MNELKTCFTEFLNIQDGQKSTSGFCMSSDRNAIGNVVKKEDGHEDSNNGISSSSASEKLFNEYATFTPPGELEVEELFGGKEMQETDVTAELPEVNSSLKQSLPNFRFCSGLGLRLYKICLLRFLQITQFMPFRTIFVDTCLANNLMPYIIFVWISKLYYFVFGDLFSSEQSLWIIQASKDIWTPVKLVSAMKGNREKQGIPTKKLSVTWAPGVYDPVPASISYFPCNNQHCHSNGKKYGKNKHKSGSKSLRGSKGKDKKQARKNSGNANKFKNS